MEWTIECYTCMAEIEPNRCICTPWYNREYETKLRSAIVSRKVSEISLLKISENTLIKRVCLPILGKCEVDMSKET